MVVAFLSTGRCGTQWLADNLDDRGYGAGLQVEHEPLGPLYKPRAYFRTWDDPEAILAEAEVRAHIERIATIPRYIETGWPLFAALPLLATASPIGSAWST